MIKLILGGYMKLTEIKKITIEDNETYLRQTSSLVDIATDKN